MPRANRCFAPGYVWHITQRCHGRLFLFKARTDRDVWRHWLHLATTRHRLCVLTYTVTSNHVHLLVYDRTGDRSIARSMQLVAGRSAQAYNRRKGRLGAFWEDRYHAVAVESGEHLWRCLAYIDLNMVRAGVVRHPTQWSHGSFTEIQAPRNRYRIVDLDQLAELCGCPSIASLQAAHRDWVAWSMATRGLQRDPAWTDAIAVGGKAFTDTLRRRLKLSPIHRRCWPEGDRFVLREARAAYA